ncbi:MAG: cyclophilin-like fold protein [Anaerolineales bacterium]
MADKTIRILAGGVSALADLNDTRTAQAIWDALPIRAQANTWGDEVYFEIPVRMGTEKGQAVVDKGDLGYWAPGRAFCIFFGLTPASRGEEIRPASPVTVVGRVRGDATVFRQVGEGDEVVLERADQVD